jgi:hypothetical protein
VAAIGSDSNTTAISGLADKFGRYVRSTSTRTAAFVGLLSYLSYAYAHGHWANPALIGVSLFVGLFLPSYAKLSNKAELWANNRVGFVTAGRLGRFVPQYAFNLAVFAIMQWGGALNPVGMASVGDANRNVLLGVSINLVLAALGTAGIPGARAAFLILGFVLGGLLFGVGLLSDLRSLAAPKGGVGMFFGTFNPFHNTHIEMVRRALDERGLDKIIIHPTLVPRLHADAFRKGELRVARLENGFQIYEKTDKADVNVDYFPTGRQFLPPETRKILIELALAENGLGNRVEVAFYPETYNRRGFQGVIGEIRRLNPGARLHVLHGTDIGGMQVRQICDECGWIYPWRILRRDKVSATAIRRGAKGMTSEVVTSVLSQLTANLPEVTAGGRRFRNDNGVLTEGV